MTRPANFDPLYASTLAGAVGVAAAQAMNASPWKRPCRVATTADVTIATDLNAGDVIDGVTLADGDRVLVWLNTAASENGIIIVGTTPVRSADFDSSGEIQGAIVAVQEGTAYGGFTFRNTNTATIVVDTDDITFEQFATGVDVQEIDGSPSVAPANRIDVPNGGLTASGGVAQLEYAQRINGGAETLHTVAVSGSAITVDAADGNAHDVTLTANCTISLATVLSGVAVSLSLVLRQDGTGSRTVTWPGGVSWIAGTAPTLHTAAGAFDVIVLWTFDGGTTWGGTLVGSGSVSFATPSGGYGTAAAGAASTALRSDAVFPKPTEADLSLSNVTTLNVSTTKHGFAPLLPNDATQFLNGVGAWAVPPGSGGSGHSHVNNVLFSGDGATVAWELPAAPLDAWGIAVYIAGTRSQDWTLSGSLLTTLTFGSAPASGTNNIAIDIVADLS